MHITAHMTQPWFSNHPTLLIQTLGMISIFNLISLHTYIIRHSSETVLQMVFMGTGCHWCRNPSPAIPFQTLSAKAKARWYLGRKELSFTPKNEVSRLPFYKALCGGSGFVPNQPKSGQADVLSYFSHLRYTILSL